VAELREALQHANPLNLAQLTGAGFSGGAPGQGELTLPVWGQDMLVSTPGFVARERQSGREASTGVQALLLYYFTTADGAPIEGRWASFADLPGGRFYNRAYQGYTGGELARAFGNRLDRFEEAARAAGGTPQPVGGAGAQDAARAFAFQPLPRLPLLAICWQGDEDFPSSYQVLFDASASHYLPIDVCAILGSMLTRRLISGR
jgi:hypothetical protein